MDECLLNDLLECSVCLDRLDTSSRVLPCQHTFCLKCLKEIVDSHKELRCPECRVLVEAKLEELPPNVLLMRILEGMRNSGPPRKPSVSLRNARGHHPAQGHNHLVRVTGSDGKPLPPHGRAIFDYIAKEPGDLSFKKGEMVLMQKKLDAFWYLGECNGRSGSFPITYIQVIVPYPAPSALCKALYDFRMSAPDEEGCLSFDKGAIITVHRRVDENWAEGRLEDRVGIFPIAFVELNQAARQLMSTSANLTRPVPPTPEHSRAGHSDHRHHATHSSRYQPMSMSTPTAQQVNYQNATMSQSHPNFHPPTTQPPLVIPQNAPISQLVTAIPRNIMEPLNKSLNLINFNVRNISQAAMGLQTVSARIGETFESRLRSGKYEFSTNQKPETTYQNVRNHTAPIASFTNSSDSSSANTPGISSTTTPNTSSDNSTSESTEPSLPSSPDNNTVQTVPTVQVAEETDEPNDAENSINTSMGLLSLNESSTATNTSLNVSLPAENASSSSNQSDLPTEAPCSSKTLRNGSEMMNFGLNLQAALSPSHSKDSYRHNAHHHREKDKRNSLTPACHLQANQHTPNRHSAEILATSLLDHVPERDRERGDRERERERRRRRSRSNERPLPAAYVALYPYKPQKTDELELKKGGIYMVSEKCRDGWFKGCSERTQRCGVFPGNYVAAATQHRPKHDKVPTVSVPKPTVEGAPDAPPRSASPPHRAIHRQHDTLLTSAQPTSFPWTGTTAQQTLTPKNEKSKEKSKQDKSMSSGISLMKRLAAMKKCKSPPPAGYSMDNPVFEDSPGTSLMLNLPSTQTHQPVHVRSGSCPSQLLRLLPAESRSASHRLRVKERPSVLPSAVDHPLTHGRHTPRSSDNPWQSQHRKSQSLDVTATRKDRHQSQPVKERFRCIVPYPPNSEYELELKIDDIVLVHRKRGDGWYKGTLQRTGRTGLFPASFVQSYPE